VLAVLTLLCGLSTLLLMLTQLKLVSLDTTTTWKAVCVYSQQMPLPAALSDALPLTGMVLASDDLKVGRSFSSPDGFCMQLILNGLCACLQGPPEACEQL
jgi:hypothetical protein